MTGQGAGHVFGVDLTSVTTTADKLSGHAETLTTTARKINGTVPEARDLPGGRLHAALRDGATRISEAVDGEAVAVDVCATDLHSFITAVDATESGSAESLAGGRGK
jgi:hypothetical protein